MNLMEIGKEPEMQQIREMEEFLLMLQEKMDSLRAEKRTISFENQELRDEIQKLNVEIQRLTDELSEMQRLNLSLQRSNDDLRNRNGLKSRREQERIEEEIKNVRDQNSKLKMLVNASSVEAVSAAQKKQKEAEMQIRIIESRMKTEREKARTDIKRLKKELEIKNKEMKEKEGLWMTGGIIIFVIVMLFYIVF